MQFPSVAEDSLTRIRENLDRRIASLGARVGDHLAEDVGRCGKMMRARYTLALGAALGVEPRVCEHLGMAVELVHNASLLHDDCVDRAKMRRGVLTPNARFGDRTGVLLGDLAFTVGMSEAAVISPDAVRTLTAAVEEMTVGEIQEEFLCGSLNVSAEGYFGVAARKTGALFEWVGTVLSQASPHEHIKEDPPRLGRSTGIILQIIDDVHDFTLSLETAGKPAGQDLVNGRLTLPGILAMDDHAARPKFRKLWEGRAGGASVPGAISLLRERGCLDQARAMAQGFIDDMLPRIDALPVKTAAADFRLFVEIMRRREF